MTKEEIEVRKEYNSTMRSHVNNCSLNELKTYTNAPIDKLLNSLYPNLTPRNQDEYRNSIFDNRSERCRNILKDAIIEFNKEFEFEINRGNSSFNTFIPGILGHDYYEYLDVIEAFANYVRILCRKTNGQFEVYRRMLIDDWTVCTRIDLRKSYKDSNISVSLWSLTWKFLMDIFIK